MVASAGTENSRVRRTTRTLTKRGARPWRCGAAGNARTALGLVATGVLVTLTGCGAQMARSGWTAPSTFIRPAADVSAAGSPSGREAFVWPVETQRSLNGVPISFVRARIRLPDGRLTRTQTISRTDQVAQAPSVAFDAAGTATAVWIEGDNLHTDQIMVAVRPRGGRFGTPVAVAAPGLTRPVLAVARDGAAAIAWSRDYSRSQVVVRTPGHCASQRPRGCFGSAQSVDGGGDATVTIGPDDTAYMAWPDRCIRIAVAPHGERFESPQAISDNSVACSQPAVAVAADGNAVIAWRASPPASEESNRSAAIRVAVRDPRGRISPPQTLSLAGDSPRICVNRQGEVIVLWQQRSSDGTTLTAAVGPIGGTFGAPTELSPPSDEQNVDGSLAVDHHGNAIVAYEHRGGVFARVRKPGQAFAAPTRLKTHASLAGPLIAANNKITAVLATAAGTQLRDWTP